MMTTFGDRADARPRTGGDDGPARREGQTHAAGLPIAFFGHDACESTVIKRATAFARSGADVLGFMFRRVRKPGQRQVECPFVDLGETVDRNYAARIPRLFGAVVRLVRNRSALRERQVYYARNIDMLLLAWAARVVSRSNAALVYEVLDVQRVFLGTGPVNRFFRWAERRLLAQCDLLVTSSPRFVSDYFTPVQGYRGATFLLENKIGPHQLPADLPKPPPRPAGPPWRIGWFGTLRCQRSLQLLEEIAARLGERVEIDLRGIPSHEDLTEAEIKAACARQGNLRYFGAFASPVDLPDIYGRVHFAWGFDYLDAGANSDWLLPNRIYEGGAFGAVCLARSGTMSGQYVVERGLGVAFDEPVAEQVAGFLDRLDATTYEAMAAKVAATPESAFVDLDDTACLIGELARLPRITQLSAQREQTVAG